MAQEEATRDLNSCVSWCMSGSIFHLFDYGSIRFISRVSWIYQFIACYHYSQHCVNLFFQVDFSFNLIFGSNSVLKFKLIFFRSDFDLWNLNSILEIISSFYFELILEVST